MSLGKFDGYWVKGFTQQILNTFGNKEWLVSNFHPGQVDNADVANMLRLGGTLKPTPVAVLQEAEKITMGVLNQYKRPLTEYQRAIAGVVRGLPGRIRPGMSDEDSDALIEQLQTDIARFPVPIPDGTVGPMFFRGFHSELVEGKTRFVHETSDSQSGVLPSISLEDVYQAAQLMVKQLDTIIAFPATVPWPGADTYEAGPWDKLEDYAQSEVTDMIGMDGQPGAYHDFVWSYAYEWGMLLQSVAQWLYLTCEAKD